MAENSDQEAIIGDEHVETSTNATASDIGSKVYARRWYVLAVYALLAATQCTNQYIWGSIALSVQCVFDWSDTTIAILAAWGCVAYLFSAHVSSWLMEEKGMRLSCILAAGLIVIGSGLRLVATINNDTSWVAHIAALVNGLAGPISLAGCAPLSVTWFAIDERATATAIGSAFNSLGFALVFLIGPRFVKERSCTNTTALDKNISMMHKETIYLMITLCAWSIALLVAILAYFPARPPSPPTATASSDRVDFFGGIKELVRNKQYWLLSLPYSLILAVLSAMMAVLNDLVDPLGVGQNEAGWLGFTIITCVVAGGIASGFLGDHLAGRMKGIIMLEIGISVGFFFWFVMIAQGYTTINIAQLFISAALASVFIGSALPLFFELNCENAYPIAESVVTGMMTFTANLFIAIILALPQIPALGERWITWLALASVFVILLPLLVAKEEYKRREIDETPRNE